MSLENIKSEHRSEPQNPLIADVLYKRGVLENWGRGHWANDKRMP